MPVTHLLTPALDSWVVSPACEKWLIVLRGLPSSCAFLFMLKVENFVATMPSKVMPVVTALCAFPKQSECPLGITKDMTTGTERVMLSDLRSLQLKKTMEIKVFVLLTWRES